MKRNLEKTNDSSLDKNFKRSKDHNSKLSDQDCNILIEFLESLKDSLIASYDIEYIKDALNEIRSGKDVNEILLFTVSDNPFLESNLPLIHHSILNNNKEAFNVLLKSINDINISDPQCKMTPLNLAVRMENLEIVKVLLQSPNIDLEAKDYNKNITPITEAWERSNTQIYFELAKHGANIYAGSQYDSSLMNENGNFIIKKCGSPEIIELKRYIKSFDKLIQEKPISDQEVLDIGLDSIKVYKEVASRRLDAKLIKEFSNDKILILSNQIREFFNKAKHHKINISYSDNFPLLRKYFGEEESCIPSLKTLSAVALKKSGADDLHDQHKDISDFYSDFIVEMSGLSLD